MPRTYSPKRGTHAGEVFASEYAYRNQLARDAGFTSYWEQRHRFRDRGPTGIGESSEDFLKSVKSSSLWDDIKAEGVYQFYYKTWIDALGHRPTAAQQRTYDSLYNEGRRTGWDQSPEGVLARFLDYIGVRPMYAYRGIAVGDSPK